MYHLSYIFMGHTSQTSTSYFFVSMFCFQHPILVTDTDPPPFSAGRHNQLMPTMSLRPQSTPQGRWLMVDGWPRGW